MSAADWLAEQRRIEQAATDGPWDATHDGDVELPRVWADDDLIAKLSGPRPYSTLIPDAEFIADARTAMPKMRRALEAVLALHWGEPYAQGPDYCAECEHLWPCETYSAITEALGVEP